MAFGISLSWFKKGRESLKKGRESLIMKLCKSKIFLFVFAVEICFFPQTFTILISPVKDKVYV